MTRLRHDTPTRPEWRRLPSRVARKFEEPLDRDQETTSKLVRQNPKTLLVPPRLEPRAGVFTLERSRDETQLAKQLRPLRRTSHEREKTLLRFISRDGPEERRDRRGDIADITIVGTDNRDLVLLPDSNATFRAIEDLTDQQRHLFRFRTTTIPHLENPFPGGQ